MSRGHACGNFVTTHTPACLPCPLPSEGLGRIPEKPATLFVCCLPLHLLVFQGPCSCRWQLVAALPCHTLQAPFAEPARTASRSAQPPACLHPLYGLGGETSLGTRITCLTGRGCLPPPSDVGRDSSSSIRDHNPHTDAASLAGPLRSCRRSGCCAWPLLVRRGCSTTRSRRRRRLHVLWLAHFEGSFKLSECEYVVTERSRSSSVLPSSSSRRRPGAACETLWLLA